MEKLSSSSHFLDLGGLDSLRAQAQKDEKGALKKVAQQFEGIFVQMLMKSMRDANAVFQSDSPLNSQYTQFYEQMRDQQLSVDLLAQRLFRAQPCGCLFGRRVAVEGRAGSVVAC